MVQSLARLFQGGTGNYAFVGFSRTTPWEVSQVGSVPGAVDSVQEATNFWRECIALKRIRPEHIAFVVPRYDWTANVVYTPYRDDVDLFDDNNPAQFFVLVDEERVYKCIDNSDGVASTSKPIETGTRIFQTSDGYRWKFMYRVTETAKTFLTESFMPIYTVAAITQTQDPLQAQFDVQLAAVNGSIDFIDVLEQGSEFVNALPSDPNNRIIGISGAAEYQINGNNVSAEDGVYVGYSLKITADGGPDNLEQIRRITAYDNKVVTLESDFPDGGTTLIGAQFSIIPSISIVGDGQNAQGEAVINANKVITRVEMANRGIGYTYATATTVEPPNEDDRDVLTSLDAIMSPIGGHGDNAIDELGTAGIMVSLIFDRSENGVLSTDADFRQFGIVINPTVSGQVAGTEEDIIHTYGVQSQSPITAFNGLTTGDRLLMGISSGHWGVFQEFTSTIGQPRLGSLKIKNPNYTFLAGEPIRVFNADFTSPITSGVNIVDLTLEETANPKNVYRQTTKLRVGKISTDFDDATFSGDGEIIGNSTGVISTFSTWEQQFITGAGPSVDFGYLELVDIQGGTYAVGETVSVYSGNTAGDPVATILSVETPEMDYRSGNVVYIQNVRTLERDDDQREEIKIVITI
jgi:hypothetical protein